MPPPVEPGVGRRGLAVVTGTGGLGTAVSLGLAERGFVVCVAARDRIAGEALVRSIKARGGRAFFRVLRLDERPADLARALRGRRVALLVNNAGTMGGDVGYTLKVNLCGSAALTLALLRNIEEGGGRVVNVGSSSHLRARDVSLRVDDPRPDSSLRAYARPCVDGSAGPAI